MMKRDGTSRRMEAACILNGEKLFQLLNSSERGVSENGVEENRERFGRNRIITGRKVSIFKRIGSAFINPFTAILFCLAGVSVFTDILVAPAGEKNPVTVIIITTMVLISGSLRLLQETRSGNAAARLTDMITTTASAERAGHIREIPLEELVVGDIVHLSAGDMVPGDLRILKAKDLFVSQSALTGESEAVEKMPHMDASKEYTGLTDMANLAFMGSNVISGSAMGIVAAVGEETVFGSIAGKLNTERVKTSFEKGVNSVSWVLIRFMLVMVPIVLVVNGFTKGDWMHAVLFAISVAVGLTPEMLPMIVTTCLAKGAVAMSREKTIIKDLNSIQNLGSMDILCTDKTGTLTRDKVVLEYHMDIRGNEDVRVLRHAFLNSYYQTGLKNLMDVAIIECTKREQDTQEQLRALDISYKKVDEVPFDFDRRRMSVVVADKNGKTQMITKGAVEEMLEICTYAEYKGEVIAISGDIKSYILKKVEGLNEDGLRVIAIAQKTDPSPVGEFSTADECDMVLIGYLAFLDPPKETARKSIDALKKYGVGVKILTGDNDKVTKSVCRQVGVDSDHILLGAQLEFMSDEDLSAAVEKTDVFAKLSPLQKSRIISALRENGHCVGYMGDGINDAAAMKVSDVGISVDTAVDIAKESANVILLEKDLTVLEKGIIEGRKTYANMIKYIKMTASSNFGNMFSVLAASAFLPFLPMESIHLILLNLIYDISCTAVPWDNVDEEFIQDPKPWDASSVGRFMAWMGPVSSIFDIATYLLMYYVICPMVCGGTYYQLGSSDAKAMYMAVFQSGWFIESMWSQSLVIHMIRTARIPFIQSRASMPVKLSSILGIGALTCIPFTPVGEAIGLTPLPGIFFAWLAGIVCLYMLLATAVKNRYIRKYGTLL